MRVVPPYFFFMPQTENGRHSDRAMQIANEARNEGSPADRAMQIANEARNEGSHADGKPCGWEGLRVFPSSCVL